MKRSPALAALLAFALVASPSVVFAQGFDFGEEDVEPVEEAAEGAEEGEGEGEEVDTQDPAGLSFTEEETETTTYADTDESQVAVVAVPGPFMDSDRRSKVQAEMESVANDVPGLTILSGSAVLGTLEASGGEACVAEPLCLADVGEQAGVERILLARVVEKPDGLELKVDYFDVDDKLFIKYDNTGGLGGTGAVVKAVKPALDNIFDVRQIRRDGVGVGDEDTSVVQTVLAWGTGGLAVASLAGGIIFGIQAKQIENDVAARTKNGEVYQMTQVEAREAIRPAESRATTANVFYGMAIGLGAVSALLFYIQGGSDVGEGEEAARAPRIKDLKVAPAVTADGFGVGAGFSF